MTVMLKALVLDFDGVVVDTEHLHHRAFEVCAPEGVAVPSWEVYRRDYIGFDDRDALRCMYRTSGLALGEELLQQLIERKAEAFLSLIEQEGAPFYPGVIELISVLSGVLPLALATGSLRSDIEPILRPAGLLEKFDAVVTADDVAASKPDPESYRLAVTRLAEKFAGLEPSCCAALEDTPFGLQAASGAGLFAVGITNTHDREDLVRASLVIDALPPPDDFTEMVRAAMAR